VPDSLHPTAGFPDASGALADGGWRSFPPDFGAWEPLVWAVGAIVGYLLFLSMNPLRGYLADSYDLLREKGHGQLVVLVAALSLAGAALDWWRQGPPGAAPEWGTLAIPRPRVAPPDLVDGLVGPVNGVFGAAVAGSERGFGRGARNVVLTLASGLLAVAVAFVVQFFLLLFLYLRVTMPGRTLKAGNLVDLAVRRVGTLWPVVLACWVFWSVPVAFGFEGWLRAGWSLAFALALAVFAFLEVSILGKNRPLREAVAANFTAWRRRARRSLWFLAVAAAHGLVLFLVAAFLREAAPHGTWLALGFAILLAFIRAFITVWLLGAWVILWAD